MRKLEKQFPGEYERALRRAKRKKKCEAIRKRLPLYITAAVLVLSAAVLLLLLFPLRQTKQQPVSDLQIEVLDVGQGDAILLCSEGHAALIDAGGAESAGKVLSALRECGIRHLDYLINTHPHEDHMGGMARVIAETSPDVLYMPEFPEALTPTLSAFTAMLEAASAKHIPVQHPVCGETCPLGKASLRFVFTERSDCTDLNQCSLGCVISCGKFSMLTAGDLDAAGEETLCSAGLVQPVTVLKCSHHGSSASSSEVFLDAVKPQVAVISCGAGNDYGHPSKQCLARLTERGIPFYRTDLEGTVGILADSTGSFRVRCGA